MRPWETQKKLLVEKIPDPKTMEEKIMQIQEPRAKLLSAMLYITAGRMTEVLSVRGSDIKMVVYRQPDFITRELVERDVLIIEHMPNRKHKKRHNKDIPAVIKNDEVLCNFILQYKNTPDQKLFDFTPRLARYLLHKHLNMNAHYLRHVRLTNLVRYTHIGVMELMKIAGWTTPAPSDRYLELRWSDIVQKQ